MADFMLRAVERRDREQWAALWRAYLEFYKTAESEEVTSATWTRIFDPLEPVHRVLNPREFNQRAVSLHVYSRPFDTCVVYSAEQGTCGEIKLHYTTEYGKPS